MLNEPCVCVHSRCTTASQMPCLQCDISWHTTLASSCVQDSQPPTSLPSRDMTVIQSVTCFLNHTCSRSSMNENDAVWPWVIDQLCSPGPLQRNKSPENQKVKPLLGLECKIVVVHPFSCAYLGSGHGGFPHPSYFAQLFPGILRCILIVIVTIQWCYSIHQATGW